MGDRTICAPWHGIEGGKAVGVGASSSRGRPRATEREEKQRRETRVRGEGLGMARVLDLSSVGGRPWFGILQYRW